MSTQFWEAVSEDHCINDVGRFEGMAFEEEDRLAKINTYFQEAEGIYKHNCVIVV